MAANFNYSRMPGPGDLPGDPRHPNSPDFDDAAYELDLQSAVEAVTANLHRACELEELVGEVRDAVPLLAWLAQQDIPRHHLSAFRALDRKARAIEKACDEYMERNDEAA